MASHSLLYLYTKITICSFILWLWRIVNVHEFLFLYLLFDVLIIREMK